MLCQFQNVFMHHWAHIHVYINSAITVTPSHPLIVNCQHYSYAVATHTVSICEAAAFIIHDTA